MDPLLGVIILLIIIGVIMSFIPIDPPMKAIVYKIILVVVCVVLLVWILGMFGLMPHGAAHLSR
jgi:hypothetical protein